MIGSPSTATWAESRDLESVIGRLRRDADRTQQPPTFPRVQAATARLGSIPVPKAPPDLDARAKDWSAYAEGGGPPPPPRALRSLCWHPFIATSRPFRDELAQRTSEITRTALIGLIISCMARWQDALRNETVALAWPCLRAAGSNPTLDLWKSAPWLILDRQAPERLGRYLLETSYAPADVLEKYRIAPASQYACDAATAGAEQSRALGSADSLRYLAEKLLPWAGLPLGAFKREYSKTALVPGLGEPVRKQLLALARGHRELGDPRLPANAPHWAGYDAARARVIEWLSGLDIRFFFDHVLPPNADKHGRKQFWLRYASRVRRSRCLLSGADRSRLVASSQSREAAAAAGSIRGNLTSAFLLDFGELIAVEFATVGRCYFYGRETAERTIIPDFWTPTPVAPGSLKRIELAETSVVHRPRLWKHNAAQVLARHGIRPF